MATIFDDFVNTFLNLGGGNPLLGIFLASLAGNLIPFFPVPYLFVVVLLTASQGGLSLIQIATLGALGAAIGKFAIYAFSYGAGSALAGSRARFDSLRKLLGGSAFLAAFIFAASPFPDDIIFIPLGIMRYSPLKTFISLFSGKFALTLLVAYLARTSSGFLDVLLGGSPIAAIASVVVVAIIAIIMMRVDWEKVLERSHDGVLRRALRRLLRTVRRKSRTPKVPKLGKDQEGSRPGQPDDSGLARDNT